MEFKPSNTATIATIDKGNPPLPAALLHPPASPTNVGCCAIGRRTPPRPPSEIYFESRGKCCKKLLRYNGYPNKVRHLEPRGRGMKGREMKSHWKHKQWKDSDAKQFPYVYLFYLYSLIQLGKTPGMGFPSRGVCCFLKKFLRKKKC